MRKKQYINLIIILLASLYGCSIFSPKISTYDSYAYLQTTSVKVDALNLMDMSSEDFQLHGKDIHSLQNTIQKICEYEKHRPKNEITNKQWEILMDTTGHLLGGFLIRWRSLGKLGKTYIDEKKKQISFAFDQIAELESKKIKPSEIKN